MKSNFKDWLQQKLLSEMTEQEAERILGSTRGDPDLSLKYRKLAMQNHPDRGGDAATMKKIITAYEILSNSFSGSNSSPQYQGQTGPFKGNPTFANVDYCKYIIEEKSSKSGSVSPFTFWAWDGDYFRGTFTVNTNRKNFDFAADIMEKWNSSSSNSYKTKAVFVSPRNHEILLLRLNGKDVSSHNLVYAYDSFNNNPGNDGDLVDKLREQL